MGAYKVVDKLERETKKALARYRITVKGNKNSKGRNSECF